MVAQLEIVVLTSYQYTALESLLRKTKVENERCFSDVFSAHELYLMFFRSSLKAELSTLKSDDTKDTDQQAASGR